MKNLFDILQTIRDTVVQVYRRGRTDHIVFLAAGLAYYSIIALVPLSAISLSLFATFIDTEQTQIYEKVVRYVFPFSADTRLFDVLRADEETASGEITSTTGVAAARISEQQRLEALQQEISQNMNRFVHQARSLRWPGLVFLIITGIWLFDSIEDAFNSIWRSVKRRPWLNRFTIFWTVLTLAPVLMVGPTILDQYIKTTPIPRDLNWLWTAYNWSWSILPYFLTWLAIWLMYVVIPSSTVARRPAAIAALIVAVLWELAKRFFAFYVVNAGDYQSVYGSLGVIVFILGWIYTSWWLILQGLEVTAYLEHPDRDLHLPGRSMSNDVCMLYAWGSLFITGRNFLRCQGGVSAREIADQLGLHETPMSRLLDLLEDKGILSQDRNGMWHPGIPLNQITWGYLTTALGFPPNQQQSLPEWFTSSLKARGVEPIFNNIDSQQTTIEDLLNSLEPGTPPVSSTVSPTISDDEGMS